RGVGGRARPRVHQRQEPRAVTTAVEPRSQHQPPPPGAGGDALPFIALGGLVVLLVGVQLATGGSSPFLWVLALLLLPFFFAQRPDYGPVVLLVVGLAIEQFGYTIGPRSGAITAKIPLFHGIGSFHVNAADLVLLMLLPVAMPKRNSGAARPWQKTPLAKSLYVVFGFVIFGLLLG